MWGVVVNPGCHLPSLNDCWVRIHTTSCDPEVKNKQVEKTPENYFMRSLLVFKGLQPLWVALFPFFYVLGSEIWFILKNYPSPMCGSSNPFGSHATELAPPVLPLLCSRGTDTGETKRLEPPSIKVFFPPILILLTSPAVWPRALACFLSQLPAAASDHRSVTWLGAAALLLYYLFLFFSASVAS